MPSITAVNSGIIWSDQSDVYYFVVTYKSLHLLLCHSPGSSGTRAAGGWGSDDPGHSGWCNPNIWDVLWELYKSSALISPLRAGLQDVILCNFLKWGFDFHSDSWALSCHLCGDQGENAASVFSSLWRVKWARRCGWKGSVERDKGLLLLELKCSPWVPVCCSTNNFSPCLCCAILGELLELALVLGKVLAHQGVL